MALMVSEDFDAGQARVADLRNMGEPAPARAMPNALDCCGSTLVLSSAPEMNLGLTSAPVHLLSSGEMLEEIGADAGAEMVVDETCRLDPRGQR